MTPQTTTRKVTVAEFAFAAAKHAQLPEPSLPEIAFAGRSNVGKSSLLNVLLERKNLVRTSKTPGCTRQINLFRVATSDGLELYAVDLPGYGFAARSKDEREQWGTLIEGYLERRETLRAIAVLVDVRRGVEDDDRQLLEFWEGARKGAPVILVATKLDKLPLSKRQPAMRAFEKAAGRRVIGFSAETGDGKDELWRSIARVVRGV